MFLPFAFYLLYFLPCHLRTVIIFLIFDIFLSLWISVMRWKSCPAWIIFSNLSTDHSTDHTKSLFFLKFPIHSIASKFWYVSNCTNFNVFFPIIHFVLSSLYDPLAKSIIDYLAGHFSDPIFWLQWTDQSWWSEFLFLFLFSIYYLHFSHMSNFTEDQMRWNSNNNYTLVNSFCCYH